MCICGLIIKTHGKTVNICNILMAKSFFESNFQLTICTSNQWIWISFLWDFEYSVTRDYWWLMREFHKRVSNYSTWELHRQAHPDGHLLKHSGKKCTGAELVPVTFFTSHPFKFLHIGWIQRAANKSNILHNSCFFIALVVLKK